MNNIALEVYQLDWMCMEKGEIKLYPVQEKKVSKNSRIQIKLSYSVSYPSDSIVRVKQLSVL